MRLSCSVPFSAVPCGVVAVGGVRAIVINGAAETVTGYAALIPSSVTVIVDVPRSKPVSV